MRSRLGSRLLVRWPIRKIRSICALLWKRFGIWPTSRLADRQLRRWLPKRPSSTSMIVRGEFTLRLLPSESELATRVVRSSPLRVPVPRSLAVAQQPDTQGAGALGTDRGCAKTWRMRNFGGPRPPVEVENIDPATTWRVAPWPALTRQSRNDPARCGNMPEQAIRGCNGRSRIPG